MTKDVLTDEKLKGYIDLLIKENLKTYKETMTMVSDAQVIKALKDTPLGKLLMAEGERRGEKRGKRQGMKEGKRKWIAEGIKQGLKLAAKRNAKKKPSIIPAHP